MAKFDGKEPRFFQPSLETEVGVVYVSRNL